MAENRIENLVIDTLGLNNVAGNINIKMFANIECPNNAIRKVRGSIGPTTGVPEMFVSERTLESNIRSIDFGYHSAYDIADQIPFASNNRYLFFMEVYVYGKVSPITISRNFSFGGYVDDFIPDSAAGAAPVVGNGSTAGTRDEIEVLPTPDPVVEPPEEPTTPPERDTGGGSGSVVEDLTSSANTATAIAVGGVNPYTLTNYQYPTFASIFDDLGGFVYVIAPFANCFRNTEDMDYIVGQLSPLTPTVTVTEPEEEGEESPIGGEEPEVDTVYASSVNNSLTLLKSLHEALELYFEKVKKLVVDIKILNDKLKGKSVDGYLRTLSAENRTFIETLYSQCINGEYGQAEISALQMSLMEDIKLVATDLAGFNNIIYRPEEEGE